MTIGRLITTNGGAHPHFPGSGPRGVFIACSTEVSSGLPDHLRRRLRKDGMCVVKGENDLPKGLGVKEAARRVIRSSSFSVVVVDCGFASSVARLEELVLIKKKETMMMRNSSNPHQHNRCFPIFYLVSPTECSKLLVGSGEGSCFYDDIQSHGPQYHDRKLAWIDALVWLGSRGYWFLDADRLESEVVDEVATTIQERLSGNLYTTGRRLHHDPYYPFWELQGNRRPPAAASKTKTTWVFGMLAASAFIGGTIWAAAAYRGAKLAR